jgi:glycosyltransferase involved in cell wall biosynthesis/predicted SAM-dependent methyltransferase
MKIDRETVDIIIPTYDNTDQLVACCSSILSTRDRWPVRIIIINNGKTPLDAMFKRHKELVTVLNPGKNLGWTGGLAYGLKYSNSKYVMFANDDIYVPIASYHWLMQLVRHLIIWKNVAAVGPSSNVVMGGQNIWANLNAIAFSPTFLIGFCMLLRRSTLDEVGGVDETFDTGDDIDLSIRFLKAGYIMIVDKSIFVYHHGFQTGEKLYGTPDKPGGWNSRDMTVSTNKHLIQKHGFMAWWKTMCRSLAQGWFKDDMARYQNIVHRGKDVETEVVLSSVNGCSPSDVLEIGCGGLKTIEGCIGLDKEKRGEPIPSTGRNSIADIVADAQEPLPLNGKKYKVIIARHVLEHCVDVIGALESWKDALADDGVMIISVPDERIADTILLNSDHVHAFTTESLCKIIKVAGMQVTKVSDNYSADSFTIEVRK